MDRKTRPRVPIVEDEYLIASMLQQLLEQRGARVSGPAAQVSTALELIASEEGLDCAMLDVSA
ncbi:MAG TPA: hypothetical protein VHJ20_03590 [Polyangia bacterium]|nr:hypothetical protein [Polyangia bacterium]